MRNSGCCLFGLVSFLSVGDVFAQPVADYFRTPVWPVDQSLSNPDGYYDANLFLQNTSGRGYHTGEDWNGNKGQSTDYGDLVYPIAVGKVVKVFDPTQKHSWGKTVIVKHLLPDGQIVHSLYSHLSQILVSLNQIVYTDKPLGKIGDANGYYVGAAHFHFEIRRVNDWTPTSPGYYPTLTIAAARKYFDPSLFLDDRTNWVAVSTSGPFTASANDFEVPDYAPASLAHVTCGNETLSLPLAIEAGWISPIVYVRAPDVSRWQSTELAKFIFGPATDFEIEFLHLKDCTLTIVFPGHNFQTSRARDDMIRAAQRAGFTRVKMETLANLSKSLSSTHDLRFLCFDRGTDTGVACTVHATYHGNPLYRWLIWYEPASRTYIGGWVTLDPNDIAD